MCKILKQLKDVLFDYPMDTQINVIDVTDDWITNKDILSGFYFQPWSEITDFLPVKDYMDYYVLAIYKGTIKEDASFVVDIYITKEYNL